MSWRPLSQSRGVPAGAVLDGKALLFDDHLNEAWLLRGRRASARHEYAAVTLREPPLEVGQDPRFHTSCRPNLGEHNNEVLRDILGLTKSETDAMEEAGIVGTAPVRPRATQPPSNELLLEQGRIVRSEPDFEEQVSNRFGLPQ